MKKIVWLSFFLLVGHLSFAAGPWEAPPLRVKLGGMPTHPPVPNTYFEPSAFLQKATTPETLRILALRVSFVPDTAKTTTGDGTFQLAKNDSVYIDPPPHNRTYFQAQLASLAHYYRIVSNRKLIIQGDVYPLSQNASYTLPHTMDYYNPNKTDAELDQRLSELLRDALMAAAARDPIPAERYDGIFVFHAGVGKDVALDYDTTPQDIPSAFLNFDHLKKTLGKDNPDFQGIPFRNTLVTQGVILPETEVQSTDIQIGLKGTLVLMTGHFLGLPALYDVKTGTSGIGKWGLMDQGSGNYFGLIPAEPCAWSKIFMGWEKPVVLRPGTDIRVGIARAKTAPHIYKIPITRDEYFLIENRSHDPNGDSLALGRDQYGNRVELTASGQLKAQDSLGVIVQVDDYDFDIPGSGILVWHIDDAVIRRYYNTNQINANPEHKGVELMEADGSQDIGQQYGFLNAGSGSELGTMYDPFFKGNENYLVANHSQTVEFGPYTAPSSRSFAGANTHIVLKNFSPIDTVMSFSFENDLYQPGFPAAVAKPGQMAFPPLIFRTPDSRLARIFVATRSGTLLGWTAEGEKIVSGTDSLALETDPGRTERFPLARMANLGDSLVAPPMPFWDERNGFWSLFTVGQTGRAFLVSVPALGQSRPVHVEELAVSSDSVRCVLGLGPVAGTQDGFPQVESVVVGDVQGKITLFRKNNSGQTFQSRRLGDAAVAGMCRFAVQPLASTARKDSFAVLLQNGWLFTLTSDLAVLDSTHVSLEGSFLPPVSGFLQNRYSLALVVASRKGQIVALDAHGTPLPGFPVDLGMPAVTRPVLADVTGSGKNEILVSGPSALFAFEPNGVLATNFPKIFSGKLPETLPEWNAPAVARVSPGSDPFIFLGNASGKLQAFSRNNHRLFAYPLQTGASLCVAPVLGQPDTEKAPIVAAVSTDGFLYVWRVPGATAEKSQILWPGQDAFFSYEQLRLGPRNVTVSGDLTGENWAYNYPNPTHGNATTIRYHLNAPARISIKIMDLVGNRVASFSGPGDGPADHEVVWSVQNIPSGVYLARVEAVGGNQTKVRFFKIAVVK